MTEKNGSRVLVIGGILIACVLGSAGYAWSQVICGGQECYSAMERDTHDCSSGICLNGTYWTIAFSGYCRKTEGSGDKTCREDGVTNITIHKLSCKYQLLSSKCKHASVYEGGQIVTDEKEVADCYDW